MNARSMMTKGALLGLALLLAALPLAAQEAKAPGKYEGQDARGMMTGKAMTNKDWWPNQLDLDILHQNSELNNPLDPDYNYAAEFSKVDLKQLKKELGARISNPGVDELYDRAISAGALGGKIAGAGGGHG